MISPEIQKKYGAGMFGPLGDIYTGDALDMLRTLPDQSVQCCVTSPPYWGLRDYGVDEQIGLEKTPEQYVDRMAEVFAEVWRVLRKDGVMFLNLGDSYSSTQRHATPYGISGKAPGGYPENGCLCENLCDVCREVYLRTSHKYDLLVPMLIASLSWPNRGYREFESAHHSTLDYAALGNRIFPATQSLLRSQDHVAAPHPSFPLPRLDEFSRQLLELCWQRGNSSACLVCGRSLIRDVPESSRMSDDSQAPLPHMSGSALPYDQLKLGNQYKDRACEYCKSVSAYNHSTLKPKNLLGIPWRLAFALQADGWYLRTDIIWHKPNPMPKSVKDRPTRAHEYIFLLSKSERYYYDHEAVKEPAVHAADAPRNRWDTKDYTIPGHKPQKRTARGPGNWGVVPCGFPGENPGRGRTSGPVSDGNASRNRRSVWTIATRPFPDAHFATFPPDLIRPCVLAGCPAAAWCSIRFSAPVLSAWSARRKDGGTSASKSIPIMWQWPEAEFKRQQQEPIRQSKRAFCKGKRRIDATYHFTPLLP